MLQVGGVQLTEVMSRERWVADMCTAAGHIAVKPYRTGEIQLWDTTLSTVTTYRTLCTCTHNWNYITELIAHKYLARLCTKCNDITVVDLVTGKVHTAYSGIGCKLNAMCGGPGQGSLLVWDDKGKYIIQLQWDAATEQLDMVRRVQVPDGNVYFMCYVPQGDLVILSHGSKMVQAVKLGDGQQVWGLQPYALGKNVNPMGVDSDKEGRVYIADCDNRRVLLVDGTTGEVIQELLKDAGLGKVWRVCCLSNPSQLLVYHITTDIRISTITLYNVTSP